MSDGGKTWKFTLEDGVKWQDGKPVTCEDVKYGVSRTFATDVITGGPNYILSYLDIPRQATARRAYEGPVQEDRPGRFDKAVTCDGNDDHLPLQEAVGRLPAGDRLAALLRPLPQGPGPGRQVQLRRLLRRPVHARRARGPNKGGTFVRNPNWTETDGPDPQGAAGQDRLPEGIQTRPSSSGSWPTPATTRRPSPGTAPPALLRADPVEPVRPSRVDQRSTAPYVDYLLPNFNTGHEQPQGPQAFAMATDKDAYITAKGGKQADPANSMCNPGAHGLQEDSTRSGRPARVTRPRPRRCSSSRQDAARSRSRWPTARRADAGQGPVRRRSRTLGQGRLQGHPRRRHRSRTTTRRSQNASQEREVAYVGGLGRRLAVRLDRHPAAVRQPSST